jgi:hypothetical protein
VEKTPESSKRSGADGSGGLPEAEIWCGGLQWALQEGYRKTDTLDSVRQEIGLWLENLGELIEAFGPKANVGDVLAAAGDREAGGDYPDAGPDDEEP